MIHRIRNIFLILFIPFVVTLPQQIESIEIDGNHVFDNSELLEWGGISEGQMYFSGIIDSTHSGIARQFIANGYFNFLFDSSEVIISPDSQKAYLTFNIYEGKPTFVNHVFYLEADTSDIQSGFAGLSRFNYLRGEIFNRNEIEMIISSILSELENVGFPFASVTIQSVHLYDDSTSGEHFADLYLKFSEGRKSTIDRVEVNGNESTNDYVIIRELRIDSGEEYSQEKVNDLPKRLNKLRFFDPVPLPQFYVDGEDNGVLLINLRERRTNNFDGIIGYVPPANENETGYVTGLVNVVLRNIFGTGRAASVRWQKLTRELQELELKYLEPWLFGYPFNINAELFQRIQDTTYVQRKIGGGIEYLATEDISASAFISTEQVIPTDRVIPIFTVYNSTSITTGLSLKIDTRDDPLAPTGGFLFETGYSFSRKNINGPAEYITPELETNLNLQRVSAGFSGYYEIFFRNVIALSVNGRELKGPFFEESDLWRLGGTRTVRGYREEQFLASRTAWANLEYRLMLTQRSYAFVFSDGGYYLREADLGRGVVKNEDVILGYGVGITIETAIGLLGVSFALANGDSFSEGKIHFGVINEF